MKHLQPSQQQLKCQGEGLCGLFLILEKENRNRTLRNALVSKMMERRGNRTQRGCISETMEVRALEGMAGMWGWRLAIRFQSGASAGVQEWEEMGSVRQEGSEIPGFFGSERLESCSWHLSNAKAGGCRNRDERILGGERREVMSILIMFLIFGILCCFNILGLC